MSCTNSIGLAPRSTDSLETETSVRGARCWHDNRDSDVAVRDLCGVVHVAKHSTSILRHCLLVSDSILYIHLYVSTVFCDFTCVLVRVAPCIVHPEVRGPRESFRRISILIALMVRVQSSSINFIWSRPVRSCSANGFYAKS